MANLHARTNSLATKRPDLAAQWNYEKNKNLVNKSGRDISTPDKATEYEAAKAWWRLPYDVPEDYPIEYLRGKHFDFEWESSIKSRTLGCGCPFLKGKAVWKGFNDLMTTNPILAKEWNYEKNAGLTNGNGKDISFPDKVSTNSAQKVWWKCSQGHEWEAKITDRVNGNNCPYCSGRRPIRGKTDLQTTNPDIVAEWHPTKNVNLQPTDVSAGSDKNVWWKCKYGHEWLEKVESRIRRHSCPYCSGQRIVVGENDLAAKYPEIAKQWHPFKNGELKPTDVTMGSHKIVWWKCDCGHEWKTSVEHRARRGQGCPVCSESHGENVVRKILKSNGVLFKRQYIFEDRASIMPNGKLKDDFALFDNEGIVVGTIEYNGIQHYKPVDFASKGEEWAKSEFRKTQKRDNLKSDYLAMHNIPQLIIPYWEFDNIEKLVLGFISSIQIGIDFDIRKA